MTRIPDLSPRGRVAAVLAIVALEIALNPLNRLFRIWLRDTVVGGVPFWLDHILFMMTLLVIVWGAIGLWLLGPRGLMLGGPERPKEAWLVGVLSGLALTGLVGAAIATLGPLVTEWHPDYPLMFANFLSNFYEEFVFRGVILALLLKVIGEQKRWIAVALSALLFCQGHLQYPPVLLACVLVAGLGWAWMTVRYRSLWPAWVSHTLADTIADALFKV